MREPATIDSSALLRFGAVVSTLQSLLFILIGIAAMHLGVERLVSRGFAALAAESPTAFRTFCAAFALIATLGLAITPAECASLRGDRREGWIQFGASLAYLGHAATVAYFTWWLVATRRGEAPVAGDAIAPLQWGVMFELVLVGGWVWIIVGLLHTARHAPRGFLALSAMKATSFWSAFVALLGDDPRWIAVTVGLVTFLTGPVWHLWIARIFLDQTAGEVGR